MKNRKYIFIVGGVMSSVGKGVTASSIGRLLVSKGYNVTAIKADPYINVDAGTMNPTEHGEVFVTEDKDETDQDIGNYERFLNKNIYSVNYMTTGRVYLDVIQKERNLEYKGKCVEVVPHIPNEINRRIEKAGAKDKADIVIIEIGGTVGEYQNILFLEAARRLKLKHPGDVAFVLVSYLPIPNRVGEMKTKPTQHAARELNSAGIQADFIVARSEQKLDNKRREKLATFCGIDPDNAISAPDADSIYEIPLLFDKENLGEKILAKLNLKPKKQDINDWRKMVSSIKKAKKPLKIAVVGKYFGTGDFTIADSYISVLEAVKHACWANNRVPEMVWVDSEEYEKTPIKINELSQYDGIIVPGGFGSRGIEGIIKAIKYVRENNIPYLGLCYGMQLASIEIARNVAKLTGANTMEINPKTKHPIIHVNPFQTKNILENKYGGTMRLGAYPCKLSKDTIAYSAYGKPSISERHRHRYEFNNKYRQKLEKAGVVFSGVNTQQDLVEIIEFKSHPFFVGVQFHPEFKSRPLDPHPLYVKWVETMVKQEKKKVKKSRKK
ncbi:CTP synthase [Patescibacteria group bacterium]|nr:CTP synthase [Patescibacteria group bacterium]MBU1673215.1 CTP synthase [Patescibacteria group bacterium]MBU1963087.1 CTP synthase [Patescibacteria group bacterium]